MKLNDYLSENGITAADFAEKIGVSTWSVNRYRFKGRVPEPSVMVKIKDVTNGEVTADSFY